MKNLEMRPEVNVTVKVTQNGIYTPPSQEESPSHIGIPTSNNIGDMLWTQ